MISRKYKIAIMVVLMAVACSCMYYFHVYIRAGSVIPHIFYAPIVISSMWWKRKGLIVAVLSSAFLIIIHIVFIPEVITTDDYARALMFLIIGFIVGELSRHIARDHEMLRAANQQLRDEIIERERTEEALRESEELFRVMVETAFDGINVCEFDPKTNRRRLLSCNDHYVEMSGYTREQLMNTENLNDLVVYYPSGARMTTVGDGIVDSMPAFGMASWKRPDGKENVYEWSAVSIKKGDKFHVIGVDRDITQRKKVDEELLDYQRRLRDLASELVLAEEHLRRRIARNLHDDVGQDLLFVKMRLAELRKGKISSTQDAALEEILKSVDKTIEITRSLMFDLSPPVLYELGLEPAVEWLTERVKAKHGIEVAFEDDGEDKPLTEDLSIGLFRATRELLVNVAKHSRAKNATVRLRRREADIEIQVQDNGVGFDVENTKTLKDLSNGFGLFDIRERLRHFGGSFQLESTLGKGTRIILRAPLESRQGH